MTAVILCGSAAQGDAASRALYRLGVPQALRDAGDYGTTLALEIIRHPTSGDYGLRCPSGGLGYNLHPLLVADPSLIVWPDELTPFVDDPAVATAAARALADEHRTAGTPATVTGEWVLAQVSAARKLTAAQAEAAGWSPTGD